MGRHFIGETPPALPATPRPWPSPDPGPPRRGPAGVTLRGTAGALGEQRDPPVEEGGEQPPQQHLVLHPRAQVAVHQLATCDVDAGACGRQTGHVRPRPRAASAGSQDPPPSRRHPGLGPAERGLSLRAGFAVLRACHSRRDPWWLLEGCPQLPFLLQGNSLVPLGVGEHSVLPQGPLPNTKEPQAVTGSWVGPPPASPWAAPGEPPAEGCGVTCEPTGCCLP